jgi:hypothetical protein
MTPVEISAPVESVPADLLVLFHVADEPAPRGRLGRVDWLLCGAVSRLRVRGRFHGERGERVLLVPNGKLRAARVLVVGVGRRDDFGLNALYRLSYDVAQAILDLRCDAVALDVPAAGGPQESPERIRQAFLEGFLAELQRGRRGAPAIQVTLLTSQA